MLEHRKGRLMAFAATAVAALASGCGPAGVTATKFVGGAVVTGAAAELGKDGYTVLRDKAGAAISSLGTCPDCGGMGTVTITTRIPQDGPPYGFDTIVSEQPCGSCSPKSSSSP